MRWGWGRMKKLRAIASDEADCGIKALEMIMESFGRDYSFKIDSLYDYKLTYFGELLQSACVNDALKHLELDFKQIEFETASELESICKENLDGKSCILIPYYALQGFVINTSKPDMKHVHWGILTEIRNDKVYGKQNNVKADILGCLNGIYIDKLLESNRCLGKVKIDFGKYHKCKIEIPKEKLGIIARCGENQFCQHCNSMKSFRCVYKCDLANKAWIIREGEEDNGKFK